MCHFWLSEKTFFKYLFFHLPNMLKDFVWLFPLSSVTHFGHMIYLKNIAQMLYFCRVLSFCNAVPYLAASVQASCKLLKSSRASKEAVIKKKIYFLTVFLLLKGPISCCYQELFSSFQLPTQCVTAGETLNSCILSSRNFLHVIYSWFTALPLLIQRECTWGGFPSI